MVGKWGRISADAVAADDAVMKGEEVDIVNMIA